MIHKNKKSLGQNFLRDLSVIENIISASNLHEKETVIEVGPGDGVLTEALLKKGVQVIAVEIDKDLIEDLNVKFSRFDKFELINEDIRRFNIPRFLEEKNIDSYKVVANLPYYITSSIIRLFLESDKKPTEMILMTQKEVAERICAKPGDMSVLSIAVQFYGKPEYVFDVSPAAFYPAPKVTSAVIKIVDIGRENLDIDEKKFFRIVRSGFASRRKKLVNNLSSSLSISKQIIVEKLNYIGLDSNIRAQELDIDNWIKLLNILDI